MIMCSQLMLSTSSTNKKKSHSGFINILIVDYVYHERTELSLIFIYNVKWMLSPRKNEESTKGVGKLK